MAIRIAILTLALAILTLGAVTMADTIFALRWEINRGFIEHSSPVAIPASVGFLLVGAALALVAASDGIWHRGREL